MTSSSSPNLNREDSFTNLSDIIIGEKVETSSTTSQTTDQDYVALKRRIDELTLELKNMKEIKACFVKVSNKWKLWYSSTCCRYNCVKQETPNTICPTWGFIQVLSNTNIKYNCKPKYDYNREAKIEAVNCFKKPETAQLCLNCSNHTLYYYEIKLIIERSKPLIEIGFSYNPSQNIYFCVSGGYIYYYDNVLKKDKFINLPLFVKNEDIIGCGVVYPPPNINNNKLPYIFFTKNGELIGKAIEVKGTDQNLYPNVILKFCSIETNFGDDLNSNPFKYDITNHIVTKEFYEEEDFTDE